MSAICKTRTRRRRARLWVFLCLLLLVSPGCGSQRRYTVAYADAFDTVVSFTAYAGSAGEFDALAEQFHASMLRYHRLFDVYREYPGMVNLCAVNRLAGEGAMSVGPELLELLQFSREAYAASGGQLNIAMGAVLSLWQEAREQAALHPESAVPPDPGLLREAAAHCRMEDLLLDEDAGTVFFADPELKLDVGAVAKGWAQARLAEELEAMGCTAFLLNMGGSILCRGSKPGGVPWSVGVRDPQAQGEMLLTLELTDTCAVTSGADQRFFTAADGTRYPHIISPDTLYPAEGYLQVTVLSPDPAEADVLSTALFLLGLSQGEALVRKTGAEALWVLPDGTQRMTEGFRRALAGS